MDNTQRTEHVKKVYAALHIRSLREFRRNLEELKKTWENALKRHEARKPGLLYRVFTKDRAYREWSDRRDALLRNLASCAQRVQEISSLIAAGGESPEVRGYVEELLRTTPGGVAVNEPTVDRSAMQATRTA